MKSGFLKISLPILTGIFLVLFIVSNFSTSSFAKSKDNHDNDDEIDHSWSPSPSPSPSPSSSPTVKGSISVCKIIINTNNQVVNGSQVSGATFSISGLNTTTSQGGPAGVIGTSTFNTPLSLNTKVLSAGSTNDAQCTTYSNLSMGNYYYGQESISGAGNWASPKYNDQFTQNVNTISDFFSYDNSLFDSNPANDASRNTNADGHIVLDTNRPNRTLVVLNQIVTSPAPTPTPSSGGGNGGGSGAPSCPANGPQAVDKVWFSDINPGTVTVHWANKGDAASYHIQYGPSSSNLPWGTQVPGNANSVTLNGITSATLWVTVTANQSDTCGGPTAGPFHVPGGTGGGEVLGASTLAGTGTAQNTILFTIGFTSLVAGLIKAKKLLQIFN